MNILRLFLSFFYFLSIMLSGCAMDGHQIYFGGTVVGRALRIGIEISFTPPLNFRGGRKVRNFPSFKTSLNFEPHAFENTARYLKSEANFLFRNDCPMPLPSLLNLDPRTPENRSVKCFPTP